jgi:HEAT repeat protein
MVTIQQVDRMLEQRNLSGLCHALRDNNMLTRRRAAQALGELGDPAAVRNLAYSLDKDRDTYVKQWAINSLAQIGNQAALDVLVNAAFSDQLHVSQWASQALSAVPSQEGQTAIKVRELIHRNDFGGLKSLGEQASSTLRVVLDSKQFATWPSGRRKEILTAAVNAGVQPSSRFRRDLAEMGVFVSGLHSVGDVLNGLRHRSHLVRVSAAIKLGIIKAAWTRPFIKNQFTREVNEAGNRQAAVAIAQALALLEDSSGIEHYRKLLTSAVVAQAADAARALAEIGTPKALYALFEFAIKSSQPLSPNNVSKPVEALESLGDKVVEILRPIVETKVPRARLLLAQLAVRTNHPDGLTLILDAANLPDKELSHQAIKTLAALNTPEAADVAVKLLGAVPRQWVIDAVGSMTNAGSISQIRWLIPSAVTIKGRLTNDDGSSYANNRVQIIQEHYDDQKGSWEWQSLTPRAETGVNGEFYLSVPTFAPHPVPRLKVTIPAVPPGQKQENYTADIVLIPGTELEIKAKVDRFVARLILETRQRESSSLV